MDKPFEGYKIIELSSVLAGPAVGMFFAELGATVIKIENKTTGGDMTRGWKQANESKDELSAYYSSVNWNKEILFLDLKSKDGQIQVRDLVTSADIVISNFRPSQAKKFGVVYDQLKAINPQIILGTITGYPDSSRGAFDLLLQAETGYLSMNGPNEDQICKLPVAFIDLFAAHQLKEGLLIALLKRFKSNKGSHVEVNLYESAIASLANQATNWLMAGNIPKPIGLLHPNIAPYGDTFLTKDGIRIILAIGTNKQFSRLSSILNGTLADDDRFLSNELRVKNRVLLDEALQGLFDGINAASFLADCQQQDVPASDIKTVKDVFEIEKNQKLLLKETRENTSTVRPKTVAFRIND